MSFGRFLVCLVVNEWIGVLCSDVVCQCVMLCLLLILDLNDDLTLVVFTLLSFDRLTNQELATLTCIVN